MRAYDGQRSDARPIQRNLDQKKRQLAALRERLAAMKSHETPALRASVESKIAELEKDIAGGAGKKSPGKQAPDGRRPARR